MKFADRAMKVQVKATANEINSNDDVLVQKLKREVFHLKQVLQMRGNKENDAKILNALAEMHNNSEEMEKLKQENKRLRLIIQENQSVPIQRFSEDVKSIEYNPNDAEKINIEQNDNNYDDDEKILDEPSVFDKENNKVFPAKTKESSFFITEATDPKSDNKSKPPKPALPSIMDIMSNSKARQTVLSMINKTESRSPKGKT